MIEDKHKLELPIPDIKTWVKYITDLNGLSVTIEINGSSVILQGDDSAYYEIPLSSVQAINSNVYLPEGPILVYDSQAEHLLVDAYSEEELKKEDRLRYKFNPQTMAQATESGKNVSTMTTVFTFNEDSINIKIGAIPSVNTANGSKFIYDNVDGVSKDDGARFTESKDWVGVVGINPICKALQSINPDTSYIYYKSAENNLLFLGLKRDLDENEEDTYVWMVSPISNEEGSFISAQEEE